MLSFKVWETSVLTSPGRLAPLLREIILQTSPSTLSPTTYPTPVNKLTDRRLWEHYLLSTTVIQVNTYYICWCNTQTHNSQVIGWHLLNQNPRHCYGVPCTRKDATMHAGSMYLKCWCNIYCLQGGVFVLQLMDTYAASWSVFLLAILECLVISYIYGT